MVDLLVMLVIGGALGWTGGYLYLRGERTRLAIRRLERELAEIDRELALPARPMGPYRSPGRPGPQLRAIDGGAGEVVRGRSEPPFHWRMPYAWGNEAAPPVRRGRGKLGMG